MSHIINTDEVCGRELPKLLSGLLAVVFFWENDLLQTIPLQFEFYPATTTIVSRY